MDGFLMANVLSFWTASEILVVLELSIYQVYCLYYL